MSCTSSCIMVLQFIPQCHRRWATTYQRNTTANVIILLFAFTYRTCTLGVCWTFHLLIHFTFSNQIMSMLFMWLLCVCSTGYPGAPTMPQAGAPPGSMPPGSMQPGSMPPGSMPMQMAPLPRPPTLPPPTSGAPGAPIPNSGAPPAMYQTNPPQPAGPTSGAPPPVAAPPPAAPPQAPFSYAQPPEGNHWLCSLGFYLRSIWSMPSLIHWNMMLLSFKWDQLSLNLRDCWRRLLVTVSVHLVMVF